MSGRLVAEFPDLQALKEGLQHVIAGRHSALETFTPFPDEELVGELAQERSLIRPVMLAGGLGTAAFAFGLQWYSAVVAYPIESGGRPLNSWQVFLLVPFEVGIFAAALCGVIAFLRTCRMPRLHDPMFDVPGFERATQDRYFLLAAARGDTADLRKVLREAGAVAVTELREP